VVTVIGLNKKIGFKVGWIFGKITFYLIRSEYPFSRSYQGFMAGNAA
jgi:hypothetical protein